MGFLGGLLNAGSGQGDGETSAGVDGVVEDEVSAVEFDNPSGEAESEPDPSLVAAGGEEGFEDLGAQLWGNAGPVVGDFDEDGVIGGGGLYGDFRFGGPECVVDEVEQDECDLVGCALDEGEVFGELPVDLGG